MSSVGWAATVMLSTVPTRSSERHGLRRSTPGSAGKSRRFQPRLTGWLRRVEDSLTTPREQRGGFAS